MKVSAVCEYSGRVRDAFIARGHDAISCDLLPTEAPGPHYRGDVMDIIGDGFDLMIAHLPCTYLAVSGMHWTTRGMRDPQLPRMRSISAQTDGRAYSEDRNREPRQCHQQPHLQARPDYPAVDVRRGRQQKHMPRLKGLPQLVPTNIVRGALRCCGLVVPNDDKYGVPELQRHKESETHLCQPNAVRTKQARPVCRPMERAQPNLSRHRHRLR